MELIHHLLWYFSSEGLTYLIRTFGLPGICLIIFSETGFFALLPGDSLLVLCGLLAATADPGTGQALVSLPGLLVLVPLCAVLGDQVGFSLGSWAGPKIFKWREFSLAGLPLFKPVYLKRTQDFYQRWGVFTVVAGRWVPIVRTFAPIVAGVTRMRWAIFITFNVVGALTWVWSMVGLGYALKVGLQAAIDAYVPGFDVARHIDKIAVAVVLLSLLPIYFTWRAERHEQAVRRPARKAAKRR